MRVVIRVALHSVTPHGPQTGAACFGVVRHIATVQGHIILACCGLVALSGDATIVDDPTCDNTL